MPGRIVSVKLIQDSDVKRYPVRLPAIFAKSWTSSGSYELAGCSGKGALQVGIQAGISRLSRRRSQKVVS